MPARVESSAVLECHRTSRRGAVDGIHAFVRLEGRNALVVTYFLNGIVGRLRVPPAGSARRVGGLWQHTCFEAFVAVKANPAYYEFNFSPSGEWAAYCFRSYRDGGSVEDDDLDPNISVRTDADRLELRATIRLDRLASIQAGASLRLGLSAVLEGIDGELSYWALKHPSEKPDFHHPDSFVLEVPFPSQPR
jgi:hypothetical protein